MSDNNVTTKTFSNGSRIELTKLPNGATGFKIFRPDGTQRPFSDLLSSCLKGNDATGQ